MSIDEVVKTINDVLDKVKVPADVMPPELIWCTAIQRPGGSPMKTASLIISNLGQMGFETGPNPDGSENMINQFVYAMTSGIYDMVSKDMVTNIATPAGTIQFVGFGADGGPVEGVNINTVLGRGTSY